MGGGIGNTAKRIIDALRSRRLQSLDYTLVDLEPNNLVAARRRLRAWAQSNGFDVTSAESRLVMDGEVEITVDLVENDIFAFSEGRSGSYDVIVAQAILDLLPLNSALRTLKSCGEEGSLWYFPLHYDGVTAFEPVVEPRLDAKIEQLYNESMSGPGENGGALTGRRLLSRVRVEGAQLLDAGSSDWIVFSGREGYTDDERTLLKAMLGFVQNELSSHPSLDSNQFATWMDKRNHQLATNELVLLVHHVDVLAEQQT